MRNNIAGLYELSVTTSYRTCVNLISYNMEVLHKIGSVLVKFDSSMGKMGKRYIVKPVTRLRRMDKISDVTNACIHIRVSPQEEEVLVFSDVDTYQYETLPKVTITEASGDTIYVLNLSIEEALSIDKYALVELISILNNLNLSQNEAQIYLEHYLFD